MRTLEQAFYALRDQDPAAEYTLAAVLKHLEGHALGSFPTLKQTIIYTISKNRVRHIPPSCCTCCPPEGRGWGGGS